jgi:single-strand DNA-binding protein
MFNEAQISVVGYVASEPSYVKVGRNDIPKLTMRVAWTTRRRDAASGQWVDANTSFVSVTCWRRLADNLATCLRKGDPVVLRGRLDVRSFVGRDGQRRTSVEVDANTLGHDLNRGVAGFRRVFDKSGRTAEETAAGRDSVPLGEDAALADRELVAGADRELVAGADRELVAGADRELVAGADRELVAGADREFIARADRQLPSESDGEFRPEEDDELGPEDDGELVPAEGGPAGDAAFDDGAIEALAQGAGSVTTPS